MPVGLYLSENDNTVKMYRDFMAVLVHFLRGRVF